MILLITGSRDGTSDLVVRSLGNKNVFRFNFDLFYDYRLEFTADEWRIVNPENLEISSRTIKTAFWWKAFSYFIKEADDFIVEEVKYIFREIYNWCRIHRKLRGNPPDFHNKLGKINILSIAKKYFSIPHTLVTLGGLGLERLVEEGIVAKSLTSGTTDTSKVLFTTRVDKERVSPKFPWYLQNLINANFDVTVFICGKSQFAYKKSREDLVSIDWRKDQDLSSTKREWTRFDLNSDQSLRIREFCDAISVDWGRLDFMEVQGQLIFLEFNANGQWVFLDYDNADGLVDHVCSYLIDD